MSPRYAYFGPSGTFTEMALQQWPAARGADWVPMNTVDAALRAVRRGEADLAMVPIENSVEGGVSATLDALATGSPLVIVGEVLVPITFVLAARPGTQLGSVTAVGTHPHAWAQVRGWMAEHIPAVDYGTTRSTASAAAGLAGGDAATYQAAVCAPVAAATYGLTVLAERIEDHSAVTRFVLVSRPGTVPEPTGADKTTLVLYQSEDHAGGLLQLLDQFASRGVNLTRIESRPTGESLGRYCFSLDCEGHVTDERLGETLMGLRRVCADVVFLGSYARADRTPVQVAPGTRDEDFTGARAWLQTLRTPPA